MKLTAVSVFTVLTFLTLCESHVALAGQRRSATLSEGVEGAQMVVVARAESVTPYWRENEHGDRLIVSRVLLRVEETLKGTPSNTKWLDLEGGTLDGVTLHVSDLPELRTGERAVFLLKANASTTVTSPHLRGQGILKLDTSDLVRGSSIRLEDIRAIARGLN